MSSSYGEGLKTDYLTQLSHESLTRQPFFKALKQSCKIKSIIYGNC